MDNMVGVLGAKAGENRAAFVGNEVAVGVLEKEDLGGIGNIGPAVSGDDSGGNMGSEAKRLISMPSGRLKPAICLETSGSGMSVRPFWAEATRQERERLRARREIMTFP